MVASPWDWNMAYMFTNFGWKSVIGILVSNGLYFLIFRKELSQLQQKFKLRNLKNEIQRRYLDRREVEDEFDQIATRVDNETRFTNTFEQKLEETALQIKERLRDRLRERYMADILKEGLDQSLLKQQLSAIAKTDQDKPIFLKADKQVPYGLVVSVMADIKESGFDKLGMITQPADKRRNP